MRYTFPSGECEGKSFSVSVKRRGSWEDVLNDARFTIHKADLEKEPSKEFMRSIIMSEHSPIRDLTFVIDLLDIPCWVSQHIARHDAFAGHTMREGAYDTHFVATSRTDRHDVGIERSKLPQDTPVNHRISLNAQDFINISQKRLCTCASYETRFVWEKVIEELKVIEPILASKCVRTCVYRGFCPETKRCGYDRTAKFQADLYEYRNN